MFDLIDECGKDLKSYGFVEGKSKSFGIFCSSLKVKGKEKSKELGLSEGQYHMISSPFLHKLGPENEKVLSSILKDILKKLLKEMGYQKGSKVLIACLGNPDIEADRLGKEVFDNIDLSPLHQDHIFKFCPNIFYFTGIETALVVKMLVKELKIKTVIIVDSLCTSSLSRLGTYFQVSSAGMTPGSGVTRFGKPINEDFLSAKCLSIGVPFMINSLVLSPNDQEIMLVPKDVREEIFRAGKVIARAIAEVIK